MSEQYSMAIGGYFELELPYGELPHRNGLRFQSARAAFLALLRAGKPKRVWMPTYICDAMIEPLARANVECVWYDVNSELDVEENVRIKSDDWLLYVNYFGICGGNVNNLLNRFSPEQIVLDYSQSFFEPASTAALATIYSPRKFFGVPDGGILVSHIPVAHPQLQDTGSLERSVHLMRRLGASPEEGYADYLQSEASLNECEPRRMSVLTERILASIDYETVRMKRRGNFLFLHEMLGRINHLIVDLPPDAAPLCYPLHASDVTLRDKLISNRVFVATYWQDAVCRVSDEWSKLMISNLLPLPIDQRYGEEGMKKQVSIILGGNS